MKNSSMIILVNSVGHKFSHAKIESPKMHSILKEVAKEYNAKFGDTYRIRRCEITKEGIKVK